MGQERKLGRLVSRYGQGGLKETRSVRMSFRRWLEPFHRQKAFSNIISYKGLTLAKA
jgi:hypothetical protein